MKRRMAGRRPRFSRAPFSCIPGGNIAHWGQRSRRIFSRNRGLGIFLLVCCLSLSACAGQQEPPPPEEPVQLIGQTPQDTVQQPKPAEPVPLNRLAVEVVVDWEDTDRILSDLDQLSQRLGEDLLACGYAVEEVAVTISTAGGFTGSALAEGGVDVVCMPAADYMAIEDCATAILTTDEAVCTGVVAAAAGREELDGSFLSALSDAMTLEGGFLESCYPGVTYIYAGEDALRAARELSAQQGETS